MIYCFWIFHDELAIGNAWDVNSYDMIYFLFFTVIIIIFQGWSDIILLNAQELYHSWPIYDYFEFCYHRFLTRITSWKSEEYEFDETLHPLLQFIDQLCFSSQYYFIITITSFGILMIYLGLSVTLVNQYPFVSDPLFSLLTMFIIFTCMISRRIFIYFSRIIQLWKIIDAPMIYYAVNEDIKPYDPLQHLRGKPVQTKFLEKNKVWLLENLSELITPDALERHRDYLMYHYDNIIRLKNEGEITNKYDISSDDGSESTNNLNQKLFINYKKIKLTKRQEKIAIWWLHRGKRIVEMRRLVDGIVSAHLEHECDNCQRNENLIVQQIISMENIVHEFDKKIKLGIDNLDKIHPVIAWRKYFQTTQLFRTICDQCLTQIKGDNNQMLNDAALISDDEESEVMDYRFAQYQVNFDDSKVSKNIAALWLSVARSRIARRSPPKIPLLGMDNSSTSNDTSINDNDDENTDDLFYGNEIRRNRTIMNINTNVINTNIKIRDDISSDTETETETEETINTQSDNIQNSGGTNSNSTTMISSSSTSNDNNEQQNNNNNVSSDSYQQSQEEEKQINVNDNVTTNVIRRYDISSDSESDQ